MTREKDFEQAAMDYCEDHSHCIYFKAGAEYGYKFAVEKACKWIRLHIGVDMSVRLTPDGEPLAEDFINKAEARVNAANKVVEQFKRFMEE
jgi:hypothetical protein